jgi:hypothetical protein
MAWSLLTALVEREVVASETCGKNFKKSRRLSTPSRREGFDSALIAAIHQKKLDDSPTVEQF